MSDKEKKEKTPKYTVVAATFADEASADAALEALKSVEKVYAADLVVMGEDGKFKKHREGKRQPGAREMARCPTAMARLNVAVNSAIAVATGMHPRSFGPFRGPGERCEGWDS